MMTLILRNRTLRKMADWNTNETLRKMVDRNETVRNIQTKTENWIDWQVANMPIKSDHKEPLITFLKNFDDNMELKLSVINRIEYKNTVMDILEKNKNEIHKDENQKGLLLYKLQQRIEDLTIEFDEESIHKTSYDILKILIQPNKENARDYLRPRLSKKDAELLQEFSQYTIEALIVHLLGQLFNNADGSLIIRVATLVEQLELIVRKQASFLKSRRTKFQANDESNDSEKSNLSEKANKKKSNLSEKFPIGVGLVELLKERFLIELTTDIQGKEKVVTKKGNSYFIPSNLYAHCLFDLKLLPMKLYLPMVCKPKKWKLVNDSNSQYFSMNDIKGGYLTSRTSDIYARYNLLSSADIDHFNINFRNLKESKKLCEIMNNLQEQPFEINSKWLKFLINNMDLFVKYGYLMPEFLTKMNLNEVIPLLRDLYLKNKEVQKFISFNEILKTLAKNIQRSRYERFIIELAKAYDGYQFDLPAFLDFRGRIYRFGILHFHERDLARSMIVFATKKEENEGTLESSYINRYFESVACHFKAFMNFEKAREFTTKLINFIVIEKLNIDNILAISWNAKHPFQFLAQIYGIYHMNSQLYNISGMSDIQDDNEIIKYFNDMVIKTPITQDASASAYQIMSWLLLDTDMAIKTNLIPSSDNNKQDVYLFLLEELKDYINSELKNSTLSNIVNERIDRKIVKSIFMPLIYGKTLISTIDDLKKHLIHYLTHKECVEVAKICFKFWKEKYPNMENLIVLIRSIGWFVSAMNRAVIYSIPYFVTMQDYMKMDKIKIWIYDKNQRKRRQTTLRLASSSRDRRKTEISTFVNFIHQKDAQIAMSVVNNINKGKNVPLYTVHDNFISTTEYCSHIATEYSNIFVHNMKEPLYIINEFIYNNLVSPIKPFHRNDTFYSNHSRIITREELQNWLNLNIQYINNNSSKVDKTIINKMNLILESYSKYTKTVAGCYTSKEEGWINHITKLMHFKRNIVSKNTKHNNYSVFYLKS